MRSLRSGGLGDRVPRLSVGGVGLGDSGPVPLSSGSRSDPPQFVPAPPTPTPQSFGAARRARRRPGAGPGACEELDLQSGNGGQGFQLGHLGQGRAGRGEEVQGCGRSRAL